MVTIAPSVVDEAATMRCLRALPRWKAAGRVEVEAFSIKEGSQRGSRTCHTLLYFSSCIPGPLGE